MKRLIALVLTLLVLPCGVARAGGIGIGVFSGLSYPVLQDDAGKGTLVGVRVPIKLVVPFIALEPYYGSTKLADKVTTVGTLSFTRAGFDEKVYGVNAMMSLGGPLTFYPFVGYGQTSLKHPGYDKSLVTYSGGLGMGISPVPGLSIDLRAEMQAAVDGQTTRKFGNGTLGVSYRLFGLP
jgi:hypothetical protein